MAGSNQTTIQPEGLEDEEQRVIQVIFEVILLGMLWCISVFANTLVCVVIYRSRRMQSTTNYFVVACASADMIYVLVVLPLVCGRIVLNGWIFGDFMCRVIRFVQWTISSTIMYTLASIAIDRYYTIIYPLSFKVTRETAKRMICFSCLVSCIFSSFSFYYHDTFTLPSNNICICRSFVDPRDKIAVVLTMVAILLQFASPVCIVTIIYIRLFRYIWRSSSVCLHFQRTTNHVPRPKVKMLKMLIVMTIVTMVLFSPVFIIVTWAAFKEPESEIINSKGLMACIYLLLITTVAKPTVYTCYNSSFRRGCKEVLCMSSSRCYRRNTYAITTASTFGKKNYVGVMTVSNDRNLDSPTKAFDRSIQADKSVWPIHNGLPTTYL